MIVWGGFDDSFNDVNTGGRFNPGTDSWTATTTGNAPAARESHTAVWTGSVMIVWGGFDNLNFVDFNTGGRYNPNTDSWTATSTNNVPDARQNHTTVWTGSEMIVWGGFDDQFFEDLNTGGVQSEHGQLDSDLNRRARCTSEPHRRLDWQQNDRLGWLSFLPTT